jgi:DNA polymerase II small subunit/DNA polymerase delta subunit B
MFLEKNVLKFIDWLNGEVGDSRQRAIAKKLNIYF